MFASFIILPPHLQLMPCLQVTVLLMFVLAVAGKVCLHFALYQNQIFSPFHLHFIERRPLKPSYHSSLIPNCREHLILWSPIVHSPWSHFPRHLCHHLDSDLQGSPKAYEIKDRFKGYCWKPKDESTERTLQDSQCKADRTAEQSSKRSKIKISFKQSQNGSKGK